MLEVKRVPAREIRRLFNEGVYPGMIARGELKPKAPFRNAHLQDPQGRGEPPCTHSQMIRYLDRSGQWVVEIHQYRRPDGSIGASGKLDPKRLRIGNTILVAEKQH